MDLNEALFFDCDLLWRLKRVGEVALVILLLWFGKVPGDQNHIKGLIFDESDTWRRVGERLQLVSQAATSLV